MKSYAMVWSVRLVLFQRFFLIKIIAYVFLLDINECEENPCAAHSKCNNTIGSFSCKCEHGFEYVDEQCVGMLCCFLSSLSLHKY